ncbi:MAG: hypothetical protein ABR909_04000 [Candidatus Bathyarchaeia archaeon]|jgi:hypothetical protein
MRTIGLKTKMMKTKRARVIALILGAALIVIAVILGGIQISHAYNIYGAAGNKWPFYSAVAIIGIIGIIIAVWSVLTTYTIDRLSE